VARGNNQDKLEGQDYNEVLKGGGKRKMRMGGMVKKMQAGGSVSKEQEEMGDRPRGGNMAKKSSSKKTGNGMTESPRPVPRPYTMEDREAVIRGNRAAARGLRMGGMVKK